MLDSIMFAFLTIYFSGTIIIFAAIFVKNNKLSGLKGALKEGRYFEIVVVTLFALVLSSLWLFIAVDSLMTAYFVDR